MSESTRGENAARESSFRESRVVVPRTARYYTLGDAATAREVWVVLHGYGQLAAPFARHFAPIADGRLVVVPEALSRFYFETQPDGMHGTRVGATWMTREDRLFEIEDYVRYLDLALDEATAAVDWSRARLVVLGFSQGTATACRWVHARVARGAAAPSRLVLWAGEIAPELALDGEWLRRTPLTYVAGDADRFATPKVVAALREKLDAAGVSYDVQTFGGDHRLDRDTLLRIAER